MAAKGLIVAGLALGGLLALAAVAKAEPKARGPLEPSEEEIRAAYNEAMREGMTDLAHLRSVASWLDQVGRPDLAASVKGKIASIEASAAARERATREAEAARREYEQQTGGPPTRETLDHLYQTAMDPGFREPAQLEYIWSVLAVYNSPERAGAVRAKLDAIRAGTWIPPYTPPPEPPAARPPEEEPPPPEPEEPEEEEVIVRAPPEVPREEPARPPPEPAEPPPLPEEETRPDMDPNGTIFLARLLLAREQATGWKSAHQDEVRAWQSRFPDLLTDGKFGPKSALKMAEEVGVLPLVRYWTGWDKSAEVNKYRDALRALAARLDMDPDKRAHAAALRESAAREKGQGWPTKPAAIDPAEIDRVLAAAAAAE